MTTRRVVLYARISVSKEESVSVARQLESGRSYAAARGWDIVGEFIDDGVSASSNEPKKRAGWSALLGSSDEYSAVIIWKVDRLARKTLDFLNADADLQARGAGIVAVEDPVDMTTAQGRAFATVLAVFAELEAATISARIKGARTHLIKVGRSVGQPPYGWQNVKVAGGGKVIAQDPERIEWVRGMVERAQRGDTIFQITKWLDESKAPTPTWRVPLAVVPWNYNTVERILRHPAVAGCTLHNPGNKSKDRGDGLLRDDRGLPVVVPELGVLPLEQWRALVDALDNRESPQARPRATKAKTSPLLSGFVLCGDERHDEPPRMIRGTSQGRAAYQCRRDSCYQSISNFETDFIAEFLRVRGDDMRWSASTIVHESGADALPEIEHRLSELDALVREASSRDERLRLRLEQDALLDLRDEKRSQPGETREVFNHSDAPFSTLWARAEGDVAEQRAVLADALEGIVVRRGSRGSRRASGGALDRLEITWKKSQPV